MPHPPTSCSSLGSTRNQTTQVTFGQTPFTPLRRFQACHSRPHSRCAGQHSSIQHPQSILALSPTLDVRVGPQLTQLTHYPHKLSTQYTRLLSTLIAHSQLYIHSLTPYTLRALSTLHAQLRVSVLWSLIYPTHDPGRTHLAHAPAGSLFSHPSSPCTHSSPHPPPVTHRPLAHRPSHASHVLHPPHAHSHVGTHLDRATLSPAHLLHKSLFFPSRAPQPSLFPSQETWAAQVSLLPMMLTPLTHYVFLSSVNSIVTSFCLLCILS